MAAGTNKGDIIPLIHSFVYIAIFFFFFLSKEVET